LRVGNKKTPKWVRSFVGLFGMDYKLLPSGLAILKVIYVNVYI
jgi:hypothetical protein